MEILMSKRTNSLSLLIKNHFHFPEQRFSNYEIIFGKTLFFTFTIILALQNYAYPQVKTDTKNIPSKTEINEKKTETAQPSVEDEKKKKDAIEKENKLKEKKEESDKKKAEWIENTIKYGTFKEIKDAISYIKTVQNESKKNELAAMLIPILEKSPDYTIIVKICYESDKLSLKGAIPQFIKLLNDSNEDVQIASIVALKNLKATEAKEPLISLLKLQDFKKDTNLTPTILDSLAAFEVNTLFAFTESLLNDKEITKGNRLHLLKYLGDSKTTEAIPLLLKYFNDPEENLTVRSYSVSSLAKINAKEAAPDINKMVKEIDGYPFSKKKDYYGFYMYCISALSKMGDPNVFEQLEKSLKSDNSGVRLQAINLLKELKDKRAIDILKYKAKYDENIKVQAAAKEALKELGIDFDEDEKKEKEAKEKEAKEKAAKEKSDKESKEKELKGKTGK